MEKSRVILLGTDELLGIGAEFPRVALDLKYVSEELHPKNWSNFMQEVNYDFNIIKDRFKRIASDTGYDSMMPDVVEYRKGKTWPEILQKRFENDCEIVVGNSHQVLTRADVAIVVSGTIALESMLCKTPVVVAYKTSKMNYGILLVGEVHYQNLLFMICTTKTQTLAFH